MWKYFTTFRKRKIFTQIRKCVAFVHNSWEFFAWLQCYCLQSHLLQLHKILETQFLMAVLVHAALGPSACLFSCTHQASICLYSKSSSECSALFDCLEMGLVPSIHTGSHYSPCFYLKEFNVQFRVLPCGIILLIFPTWLPGTRSYIHYLLNKYLLNQLLEQWKIVNFISLGIYFLIYKMKRSDNINSIFSFTNKDYISWSWGSGMGFSIWCWKEAVCMKQ